MQETSARENLCVDQVFVFVPVHADGSARNSRAQSTLAIVTPSNLHPPLHTTPFRIKISVSRVMLENQEGQLLQTAPPRLVRAHPEGNTTLNEGSFTICDQQV